MNTERLLRLAGILEAHADNGVRFTLGVWRETDMTEKNWCGTHACACGLAMRDRSFRRQGFGGDSSPMFGGLHGMEAVSAFFDIHHHDAGRLFYADHYTGKTYGEVAARKVAKRIRSFVADPIKTRARHPNWPWPEEEGENAL